MKKIVFLLISALAISLSSYAQGDFGENGFIYSGDGTEYINGEASIKIHDFGFKIDDAGCLRYTIKYKNLREDKRVSSVRFYFKILIKGSDMKNKKYRYCKFYSYGWSSISVPTYEGSIGYCDDEVNDEYDIEPSFKIVGVNPEDVIGVQITKIEIEYYRGEKYVDKVFKGEDGNTYTKKVFNDWDCFYLSGFPKNSKIRRSDSDNLERDKRNADKTQSSVSSNYANKTQDEKKEEIKQWLQGTWEWSGRIHIYGSRYDNVSMKIVVKGNNITAYGNGRVQDQGNIKSIDPYKGRITFGEYSYLDFDYNTRKQVLYTGKREEGTYYKKTSSPAPKKTSNNSAQNVWQW